jgi:hypothetical protein
MTVFGNQTKDFNKRRTPVYGQSFRRVRCLLKSFDVDNFFRTRQPEPRRKKKIMSSHGWQTREINVKCCLRIFEKKKTEIPKNKYFPIKYKKRGVNFHGTWLKRHTLHYRNCMSNMPGIRQHCFSVDAGANIKTDHFMRHPTMKNDNDIKTTNHNCDV